MRSTGVLWEDLALAHLQQRGLELLARNFTCRFGEIDLIMRNRDSIVFVEVRYRSDSARGDGIASVGAGKRTKLTRTASAYLQAQPQFAMLPCRFDVIGCSGNSAHPQLDWIRDAFDAF